MEQIAGQVTIYDWIKTLPPNDHICKYYGDMCNISEKRRIAKEFDIECKSNCCKVCKDNTMCCAICGRA